MSTALANVETSLFDYAALPDADRAWLREQEEKILLYCRRTLLDHINAGEVLMKVRNRLPQQFKPWLETCTPLSRSVAYCLMDVAEKFTEAVNRLSATGTLPHTALEQTGLIDTKALYVLSQSSVPPIARERALIMAADDKRPVTIQDARTIIAAERKRGANGRGKQKTLFERGYDKVRAEIFKDECKAEPPQPDSRAARAFGILSDLCRETSSLSLGTVDDMDDEDPQFIGRAIFKQDGRPAKHASGARLEDVVEQLAGREEMKSCTQCKARLMGEGVSEAEAERRSMRPLRDFNSNRTKADGLSSECRACYKPRMKRVKARKQQERDSQAA